jgi:DNA-directed RNA polymerase specialized sigma24 family protein
MRTSEQEALWVLRAEGDDREALELLLRHLQPSLRRFLTGVVGPSDADDVMQEVVVVVYRWSSGPSRHSSGSITSFEPAATSIAWS